jgi:uncharacterized cupin superfamily protein
MSDWFVKNVRDAFWVDHPKFGATALFESEELPFEDYGLNIRVLGAGQPASMYHSESQQENFLVLAGRCTLVVEGEERELGPWDFVHCAPGAAHVFVGAGDEPCVVLMVGARRADEVLRYPVDERAASHGASVAEETSSPAEAYRDQGERPAPGRPARWDELPWA